jgi:putative transposase
MVIYRRNRLPGGCYFFTVTLLDRSSGMLIERIEDLREGFVQCVVSDRSRFRPWW